MQGEAESNAEPPHDPTLSGTNLICFGCGYDLRGQPLLGRCPECGLEVEQTLDSLLALDRDSNPRRIRRAAIFAIAATITPAIFILFNGLLFALPFQLLDDWVWRAISIGITVTATLGTGLFMYLAARPITRAEGPSGLNKRVLQMAGWTVPALVAVIWVLVFSYEAASPILSEAILPAMLLTCGIAASLFPVTMLAVRMSVARWPVWRALPSLMRIVLFALWIGLGGLWGTFALAYANSELDLGIYEEFGHVLSGIIGISAIALAAGLAGFLATLIATLLGLRRLRRLGYAQGSDQRQGLDRDSLLALIEKIRQERQLAPGLPQGLQVQ